MARKCSYSISPLSVGSTVESSSVSSAGEVGGTPRAVRARRRDGDGRTLAELLKSWKADLISASMLEDMPCSLASLERGGARSVVGGTVVRDFLGGWRET